MTTETSNSVSPAEPLGPTDFPVPFGIDDSGERLPGVTEEDLGRIDPDRNEVRERGERGAADHLAIADIDPNNLEEAGWCVVFTQNADPAIKAALQPLLTHRETQAKRLFKVFEGAAGFLPGDDARKWIERQGVGFNVVDPEHGVPVYVLLVGSPEEIPFEFQYLLDLYWNVGRLHFDTADEYRAYAESVVAYETPSTVPQRKRAAIFTVKNDGDRATGLLHDQVSLPIVNGTSGVRTLAGFKGFQLTSLLAENATKERLTNLLAGKEDGGAPAFLFTGSHGVKFKIDDPTQRDRQGALLCQDWPGFGAPAAKDLFTADDIPADAQIHGLIHFLFACYGGGCPREDNFGLGSGQPPKQLMREAVVARLPQKLLTKGALASLAHVDRAWAYSFQNSRSSPQVQDMRDVMVRILQGQRVGQATDNFNMRWAVLSAELQESQNLRAAFDAQLVSNALLANRWVARNDARNYVILGDPAVHLRTDVMQA
jgi:Peptidase family C25